MEIWTESMQYAPNWGGIYPSDPGPNATQAQLEAFGRACQRAEERWQEEYPQRYLAALAAAAYNAEDVLTLRRVLFELIRLLQETLPSGTLRQEL